MEKFGWTINIVSELYIPQYNTLLKLIKWENKEKERAMKRGRK